MRVIVVEDNSTTRLILERILESRGHTVISFPSAEEAWERLSRETVPLCLFDWMLPGMDGLELCRRVRTLPDGRNTVILMVTGRDSAEDLQSVLDAGANDYLAKPIVRHLLDVRLAVAERQAKLIAERREAENDRRRLEAQMLRAQKMESLGVLAGGIAHDFNNLLVGILGNADMALLDLERDSPIRNNLKQIVEASSRAAELTKQMLAYSGQGKFIARHTDLNQIIEDMENLIRTVVSAQVSLEKRLTANLPPIRGDQSQLGQVVMNLVTNASEAIGDRVGKIVIATHAAKCVPHLSMTAPMDRAPEGPCVILDVVDTGSGMDEETRDRIFDPFFTTKFTGRGLGMAAVLGIVRAHGGVISVDSEPGRGTSVRVCLPSSPQRGGESAPLDDSDQWQSSGAILIVDDEPSIRSLAQRMLERTGFAVLAASNGREAIEMIKDHGDDFVLVLIDMGLPDMTGVETLRAIRRVRENIPAIFMSGHMEEELHDLLRGQHTTGFLQKPYRQAQLIAAVQRALEEQ